MTKGEFLQILESFPGKEELALSTLPEGFKLEYAYLNFDELVRQINKRSFMLCLPKDEEVWFKLLSFLVIATEYEVSVKSEEELLTRTSQKVAERIREMLNQKFHNGQEISQDLCGIEMKELVELQEAVSRFCKFYRIPQVKFCLWSFFLN